MSSNTAGRITAIIAHQGDVPINRLNSVIESLMQVFDERIAELEQQLAILKMELDLMNAVRPSQQEIDDKDILIASMTEGAESLIEENASLKERIAELEAHNQQLLADKEASPAIIAGYRERGEQLLARVAELEQKGNCLKWHQGMAKLEKELADQVAANIEAVKLIASRNKENALLLAENERLKKRLRMYIGLASGDLEKERDSLVKWSSDMCRLLDNGHPVQPDSMHHIEIKNALRCCMYSSKRIEELEQAHEKLKKQFKSYFLAQKEIDNV